MVCAQACALMVPFWKHRDRHGIVKVPFSHLFSFWSSFLLFEYTSRLIDRYHPLCLRHLHTHTLIILWLFRPGSYQCLSHWGCVVAVQCSDAAHVVVAPGSWKTVAGNLVATMKPVLVHGLALVGHTAGVSSQFYLLCHRKPLQSLLPSFFFFLSTTYIVVYSKQSAQYSKLHLLVPDGHEEDSKLARITPRVQVGGSVNHRHVNMRGH